MKKFVCDRCGKEFIPLSDDSHHLELPIKTVNMGERANKGMDLCEECRSSLAAMLVHWVGNKEPKEWR